MDPGFRSPLIDFFRRGEVASDVRMMAAEGALAPRAHEQLALLILLSDDPEAAIADTANATLSALPAGALQSFLARADVPAPMRDFFVARGVRPSDVPAPDAAEPLVDVAEAISEAEPAEEEVAPQVLSTLPIMARIKLAMKGTRTHRAQLIRDSNKLVAAAVMSSPKLTETEVEAFAKMANVSEDVLRIIASNRAYTKNYSIISALTRNPKCPPAISMQMIQRLNERDQKSLSIDRNVPEAVRLAARKFVVQSLK
jgi:hypothetical protein